MESMDNASISPVLGNSDVSPLPDASSSTSSPVKHVTCKHIDTAKGFWKDSEYKKVVRPISKPKVVMPLRKNKKLKMVDDPKVAKSPSNQKVVKKDVKVKKARLTSEQKEMMKEERQFRAKQMKIWKSHKSAILPIEQVAVTSTNNSNN